jgi:hypothetical protein
MCVIKGPNGWLLTATYRHGGRGSAARHKKKGTIDIKAPRRFRLATAKVRAPCVLIDSTMMCVLTSPEQVFGLAQWLVAASMQMTTDREEEGTYE